MDAATSSTTTPYPAQDSRPPNVSSWFEEARKNARIPAQVGHGAPLAVGRVGGKGARPRVGSISSTSVSSEETSCSFSVSAATSKVSVNTSQDTRSVLFNDGMASKGPHHVVWGAVEEEENSVSKSSNSRGQSQSCSYEERQRKDYVAEVMQNVTQEQHSSESSAPGQDSQGESFVDIPAFAKKIQEAQERIKNSLPMVSSHADIQAEQIRLHEIAQCTPCHYLTTRMFCRKGKSCSFCHEPHQKQTKPRPRKAKRAHCKKVADALDRMGWEGIIEGFEQHAETLIKQGSYMSMVVRSKLKGLAYTAGVDSEIARISKDVLARHKERDALSDSDIDSDEERKEMSANALQQDSVNQKKKAVLFDL